MTTPWEPFVRLGRRPAADDLFAQRTRRRLSVSMPAPPVTRPVTGHQRPPAVGAVGQVRQRVACRWPLLAPVVVGERAWLPMPDMSQGRQKCP